MTLKAWTKSSQCQFCGMEWNALGSREGKQRMNLVSFWVNEFSMSFCNRYGFVQFMTDQISMHILSLESVCTAQKHLDILYLSFFMRDFYHGPFCEAAVIG
jgi:hypothetical protein